MSGVTVPADVEWLDLHGFAILCPLCHCEHIHQSPFSTNRRRFKPSCVPSRNTMLEINGSRPSRNKELSYELDKMKIRILLGKAIFLQYQQPAETLLDAMETIESKTIAVMRRGGGLPDIYAKSGWKHDAEQNIYISGKHWVKEVIALCREIGFVLLPNFECDQGVTGRFSACHAEKQLIAYFICKHLVLPHELHSPVENYSDDSDDGLCRGLAELKLQEGPAQRSEERAYRARLATLWQMRPWETLKSAVIFVSRSVCDSCDRFVKHVNAHFGLAIQLQGPS